MHLFRRHRSDRPSIARSSISRPVTAAQEPAAHEDCDRQRTVASTLKTRETCAIAKYLRLRAANTALKRGGNPVIAEAQNLKRLGENVNGATTGATQERQPHTDQTGISSADQCSRVNTTAAARTYTHTGIRAGGNKKSASTPARRADPPSPAVVADELLFAPYQPIYRPPYDLNNQFDRTNLAIVIRGHLERREDYLALINDLYRSGLMSPKDHMIRGKEVMLHLGRHRRALARLFDISGGNL